MQDNIYFEGTSNIAYSSQKPIARVRICGSIELTIFSGGSFIKPTPEQIKNLKEMLCIDVELLEGGC